MKGLALQPQIRFQNVDELSDAIHERTEVDTPKVEIRKKKRKRLIQVIAIAAVLIAGLTVSGIFYMKRYRKTHLKATTISVWLSYSGDGSGSEADKAARSDKEEWFLSVAGNYKTNFSQITLEIEYIPEGEYAERMEQAAKEGKLPAVYSASGLGDTAYQYAGNIDEVYDDLTLADYYGLEEYHKSGHGNLSIPMGIDVPVAYVRRGEGVDLDTVEVTGFDQLKAESSKGYYISPKYYSMVINSMGGEYGYQDKLVLDAKAQELVTEMTKSQAAAKDADARTAFSEGKCTYYLAGIRDYTAFYGKDEFAGLFAVRPVKTGKISADYCDIWCMAKDLGEEQRSAAVQLLVGMLNVNGQMAMHGSHFNALPINKEVFDKYLELRGNMGFLKDTVSQATFRDGDQGAELSETLEMNEAVVVKKEKTIGEWLED